LILQGGSAGGQGYDTSPSFYFEENSVLVLDFFEKGEFIIQYDYLPERITADTPDDFELEYTDDINDVMAYYAASRLVMDSDDSMAVVYNNMYEVRKAELMGHARGYEVRETFVFGDGVLTWHI
jgi:hypothetical protein